MARFMVGDLVEVLWVHHAQNLHMVGKTTTIRAVGICGFVAGCYRTDGCETDLNNKGKAYVPEQLRLRRPPSWDRWLYDTRDVERECKEGQPA